MDELKSFIDDDAISRKASRRMFLTLWPDLRQLDVEDRPAFEREAESRWRSLTQLPVPYAAHDWETLRGFVGLQDRDEFSEEYLLNRLVPWVVGHLWDSK